MRCTTRLAAHGAGARTEGLFAGGARRSVISRSQESSASTVRQFGVGKLPIIPDLHAATTRSVPETRNIGAEIKGKVSCRFKVSTVVMVAGPGARDNFGFYFYN